MAQTSDFQIPNGTGQAVRLDIESAVLALASCSSGQQSNLGTTQPCQLFADTDNNLLKIRDTGGNSAGASATFHTIGSLNTANLGLLSASGGTLSGVLQASAGSTSAPSINFGNTTTGFFRQAANVVAFTGANNLAIKFSNNGLDMIGRRPVRLYDTDSSNFVQFQVVSSVSSSDKTITVPDETGTLLTSASSINTSQLTGTSLSVTNVQATTLKSNSTSRVYPKLANSSGDEIGRAVKAYVNFDGTSGGTNKTIRNSFNVSTVGDFETGGYQVNFANNMSTSNYIITNSVSQDNSGHASHGVTYINTSTMSTSSFRSRTFKPNSSSATIDKKMIGFMIIEE